MTTVILLRVPDIQQTLAGVGESAYRGRLRPPRLPAMKHCGKLHGL
jgi:hypothetical protein